MSRSKGHGPQAAGIGIGVMSGDREQVREERSRQKRHQGILQLGAYAFEGPYGRSDGIRDEPGILVMLDTGGGEPIDFKETSNLRSEVICGWWMRGWRGIISKDLMFAVLYIPDSESEERRERVKELRHHFLLDRWDKPSWYEA